MYDLALYEAFSLAKNAQPELESLDFNHLNDEMKIMDYINDFESNDFIPNNHTNKNRTLINSTINKLRDRILLTNSGLSKQETLGTLYYKCQKDLIINTICRRKGFYNFGYYHAKISLSTCKKYMFNDLSAQFLEALCHFAFWKKNKKEYSSFLKEFEKYNYYSLLERSVRNKAREIRFEQDESENWTAEKIRLLKDSVEEFRPYKDQIPSFWFHAYYYQLQSEYYIALKNYDSLYNSTIEAISWYSKNAPKFHSGIYHIIYTQLYVHIQNKDFVGGHKLLNKLNPPEKYLQNHALRILENYFFLYTHWTRWSDAYRMFERAKKSKYFYSSDYRTINRWQLYEAYLQILIDSRELHPEKKGRFKVQKFLNSLPDYAKDKEVMNISLIIAKFCFLVVRKKYTDCLQYAEALEKYKQRHLRKFYHERCRTFLKMLITIPKNGFNQKSVIRKTDKLLNELNEIPLDIFYVPIQIEIIPYEKLWEVLVNSLSHRHYFRNPPSEPVGP